jgi:hypothetical protein
MDLSGEGIPSINIPNSPGRFNGTAEYPYAPDYEFNILRRGVTINPGQKLFIGGNSFPGTTIAAI